MNLLMTLLLCFCFSLGSLFSANAGTEDKTSKGFPIEISASLEGKDYSLALTGVATRKKLIIKIYTMAHYLEKGPWSSAVPAVKDVMSEQKAKQITMRWLRDVEAKKIKETYEESFHNVLSDEQYAYQQSNIESFLSYFGGAVHKGDEYVLIWFPKDVIEVHVNGNKTGSLKGEEFAKALWSIWFGDKSVVNRNDLFSEARAVSTP